jgi:hypothetical protein
MIVSNDPLSYKDSAYFIVIRFEIEILNTFLLEILD